MTAQDLESWQARFEKKLAQELESQNQSDAAHDLSHLRRVWQHCKEINEADKLQVEPLVLMAAAYFHDIVNLPKNSKNRKQASQLAAEKALAILTAMNFPNDYLEDVASAIESHSYSAGLEAKSPAAKIVQDADRLEALGALGITRLFYVAGQMQSQLFDADDPWASNRELDDRKFALDHFFNKIFNIETNMQTVAGRKLAGELTQIMREFLAQFKREIGSSP